MKNKFGFTLVELLIAITIGMLAIGFGSMALNNFNEQQKVEMAKQELLANLRLARNYAITNQLNGGNKAVVTISNGLVVIDSKKEDNSSVKTFFSKDITPDGITITFNPTNIYFSVNDGRSVTNATPLVGTAVTISVGNGTISKNIKIDESGVIYEE